MTDTYAQKVNAIRQWLETEGYDAFIIPHEDEFLGEYLPDYNNRLYWSTGFTGSAGAAVITQSNAAIFVDGRYTVQVKSQVPDNIFEYHHLIETPPYQWLLEQVKKDGNIAIDPKLHSASWVDFVKNHFANQLNLHYVDNNPIDILWQSRPEKKLSSIKLMDIKLVGKSSEVKRQNIADVLKRQNIDAALLTKLDSICWLLNIRGRDVPCLPVLLTQAILYSNGNVDLFIDPQRAPDGFSEHVGSGVSLLVESKLKEKLQTLAHKKIQVDPKSTNAWFIQTLAQNNAEIVHGDDPCVMPKATKNLVEIQGMKESHIRDGVAITRFLAWLDSEVSQGRLANEEQLAEKLLAFRQLNPSLVDLSFNTISAAGSNAAMCHYNHEDQIKPANLELNNVYLVDSGGQYPDGTTDITRTVAIGECSTEIKKMFTLVLKGHIALACARFPNGTSGSQLDALARQYLWQYGFDYDHGTGHGVGHFLSVHEDPQRISKVPQSVPLLEGMVLSNEPGYYRDNAFGIRIENLELVVKIHTHGDRDMLGFESLTRAPIDKRLVDINLLTDLEITWWNDYHLKVWEAISPRLTNEKELRWLKQATNAISR